MVSEMLKRAANAVFHRWNTLPNCPGDMYSSEALRLAGACLEAALDPGDEALVEAVALVIQYSGLSKDTGESIRGARFDECAEIARAAIKALRSSTAQGEQTP